MRLIDSLKPSKFQNENVFDFTAKLRLWYVFVSSFILVVAYFLRENLPLPFQPLWLIVAFWILTIFTVHWVEVNFSNYIVATKIGLVADTIAFYEIMVFTGGVSNPLNFIFLFPPVISALTLDAKFTWALSISTVVLYFSLFFWHLPFPLVSQSAELLINVHYIGMWITFTLAVILMSSWISSLSKMIRDSEAKLQKAHNKQLEDEYWLNLGIEAANLAHQLSTPLNNLILVSEEVQSREELTEDGRADMELMDQQLEICKDILMRLKSKSESSLSEIDLYKEFASHLSQWRNIRPEADLEWSNLDGQVKFKVLLDDLFWSAFFNILNNAADAGKNGRIAVSTRMVDDEWHIDIHNESGFLTDEQLNKAGLDILESSKPAGLGLGVKLSYATLARLKGSLVLKNHPTGGVIATIKLPLTIMSSWKEEPKAPQAAAQPAAAEKSNQSKPLAAEAQNAPSAGKDGETPSSVKDKGGAMGGQGAMASLGGKSEAEEDSDEFEDPIHRDFERAVKESMELGEDLDDEEGAPDDEEIDAMIEELNLEREMRLKKARNGNGGAKGDGE